MTNLVASAWTADQWTSVIVIGCSSIGSMVVAIITALRTKDIHRQVYPPSNGRTLAALVEGQAVKGSMVAQDYVERVKASQAGNPPPPPPVIPTSLTPTVDDPTLMDKVQKGITNG